MSHDLFHQRRRQDACEAFFRALESLDKAERRAFVLKHETQDNSCVFIHETLRFVLSELRDVETNLVFEFIEGRS